jgi:hypothetical protein
METVTLNTITTEIASSLKRELDVPFKRMLAHKVDAWRSRLIRNSLQTKPNESKFFRQTIYILMQPGTSLPSCVGLEICPVAISTKQIPMPLRFGSSIFDYVGSVDGKTPFYEAAPGTLSYLMSGRYSHDVVFYTYVSRRFEVDSHPNLPAMRADGVFDQPSAVLEFNCSSQLEGGVGEPGSCDFWDMPYPVTGDIKQMIVQSILQVDFAQPAAVPEVHEVEVNPA